MKFFEGDIKNAISRRKNFCSAFFVFVDSRNMESNRFRQLLDNEDFIPPKEYIAFRITPPSPSYKHFLTLYKEVPVPSLFILGASGQPIRVLSTCESKDAFYAAIKEALRIHKADYRKYIDLGDVPSVRILLKLPQSLTVVAEFPEESALEEVKLFVRDSLQVRDPFRLIVPFPRKEFTPEDESQSLVQLHLNPNSTIHVETVVGRRWTPNFLSRLLSSSTRNVGGILRFLKNWFLSFFSRSRN